jgi:competence protein ComEC
MTPEFLQLWRTSLRLRPLLWLTPCIVGGSLLGLRLAAAWETGAPSPLWLAGLIALLFTLLLAASFYQALDLSFTIRLTVAVISFSVMSIYAVWRTLPPLDDISYLTSRNISRSQPLRAPHITLRGYVADFPQRGEFSTQFPLQCFQYDHEKRQQVPNSSLVWISMPPTLPLDVGDAIQVQGELRPLARATNSGQREEHWRFVLQSCWSRLSVKEPEFLTRLNLPPRYTFKRRISSLRLAILKHYERAFLNRGNPYPRANAQLLTAMVFGEGGLSHPLPSLVREQFRIAGLSHVLVASGSQIAFCAALLLGLGKVFGLRGKWLLALVVPLLFLYASLAGGAPSIMRATVAGVLVTIAVLSGRDTDPLSLWLAALLALVVIDPVQLMSLSLQLSFAAAWGLIMLAPLLQKMICSYFGTNFLTELTAFSLAAQIGILPILLYHFGTIGIAGLGANLLAVPLAGILVATGIGGLVLPLAWLNEWLTRGIAQTATLFSGLPGAQAESPPLQLGWVVTYYALLSATISFLGIKANSAMQQPTPHPSSLQLLRDHWLVPLAMELAHWRARLLARWPQKPLALGVLLLSLFVLAGFQRYQSRPEHFRLTMLDVGQGESLVAISPERKVLLVDGGGDVSGWRADVGRSVIVPYLQAKGIRKIDFLVLTHTDADHCNGLLSVLEEVPVDMVLDGTSQHNPAAVEYNALKKEILRRGIPLQRAHAGQRLPLGTAQIEVLAPFTPALPGDNNNSVVLRLEYQQTSFLLTGDIEQEAEERLTRRGVDLNSTILKVAHHGSRTSTSLPILNAIKPQATLISCGRYNQFGHPSADVLDRLDAGGIPVFRTDIDGAIEVFSDGRRCWVDTAR